MSVENADLNIRDGYGYSPLHTIVRRVYERQGLNERFMHMFNALVEDPRTDLNSASKLWNDNIDDSPSQQSEQYQVRFLKRLVEKRANRDIKDSTGKDALSFCEQFPPAREILLQGN